MTGWYIFGGLFIVSLAVVVIGSIVMLDKK